MPTRPHDKTREYRLRRAWLRRGLTLVKAYGESTWFVYDRLHRARVARVFYSLDEVEAALDEDDAEDDTPAAA